MIQDVNSKVLSTDFGILTILAHPDCPIATVLIINLSYAKLYKKYNAITNLPELSL